MDLTQLLANYNSAAAQKLATNSDLLQAEANYALAVTSLMAAIQSHNQSAIDNASQALLMFNSALTSAQLADANATAAFTAALNALVNAVVGRIASVTVGG